MQYVKGKTVLVTGGASGIGLCLAENLAKAGSELIITDINGETLATAAEKLRDLGAKVHTRQMDVCDREAVEELARWAEDECGGVDILVNNAGIGHTEEMVDTSLETWKKLMDVNFWGVLYHVYAFLPAMMARRRGHIVNVSSGQAFFRLPTWGPYATIKLAMGAFSEILRYEVGRFNIRVTTVYPFMVNTPFYQDIEGDTWGQKMSMRLLPYYSMTPERAGKVIYKAIRRRKAIEMMHPLNDVAKYMRFIPGATDMVSIITMLALGKKR